jgi:hypothetical protein
MRSVVSCLSRQNWATRLKLKQRLNSTFLSGLTLATIALGMTFGYTPAAHAALDALICPADRLNSNGNICTANDVSLAAAVVGESQEGFTCSPGQQIQVEIDGNLTVRKGDRYDLGVWIATDGKSARLRSGTNGTPNEGGAATCEVMPLTSPHGVTPEAIGNPFIVSDFDVQGDCADTNATNNADTSERVQLTSIGDSIIDGLFDINNDGIIDGNDDDAGVDATPGQDGQIPWYQVIDGYIDLNENGVIDGGDDGFWPGLTVGANSYAVIDGAIDVDGSGVIDSNDDDARSFNDEVTLTCVPGPTGGVLLSSLVSWSIPADSSNICNALDVESYNLQSSKCSTNDITLDVDVVGTLTIIKNAPLADPADQFEFSFTNSRPTLADSDNPDLIPNISPSSPFNLAHNEQDVIYGVIGEPNPNGGFFDAVIVIDETNLPTGWELNGISCTGDDLEPVVIDLANNRATVTLRYNEADPLASQSDVTCTFNNQPQPATITVVKNSTGGDDTFNFTWASTNNPNTNNVNDFTLTTVAGTDSTVIQILTGLGDTDFVVSELLQAGWEFGSAQCLDQDSQVIGTSVDIANFHAIGDMQLNAGDDITCTFNNVAQGTVTINKATVGGDGTFNFTSTDLGGNLGTDFNLITTGGNGSTGAINNLSPGTYTVVETDPQVSPGGWDLTNLTCIDLGDGGSSVDIPTRTATIDLDPGETISCTFTNRKRGTAIVEKQTLPDGSLEGFSFTGDISGGPIFDGGQIIIPNLLPGQYGSIETVPAGWELTSIVCDDGNSSGDLQNALAVFNIEAGEVVTCVFTNTQNGSIEVVKSITATGPASQTFDFTGNGVGGFDFGGGFSLTPTDAVTDDSQTFSDLTPGGYSVAEANPVASGWIQAGASCTGGDDPSSITVSPGENVICTFTNAPLGSSTVVKNSVGGEGLFGFTWDNNVPEGEASTFDLDTTGDGTESRDFSYKLLPLIEYDVSETSVPADVGPYGQSWVQSSVGCVDPDQDSTAPNANDGATIIADTGETVTCTFTNTLDGTLIVRKETIPDGNGTAFSFSGDAALTGDIRDYSAFTEELVLTAQPGTYGTAELVPDGWLLTNINCTGQNSSAVRYGSGGVFTQPAYLEGDDEIQVVLEAGETVICTFTNTLQGGITINKTVIGADTGFNFDATYDQDGFILANGQSNYSGILESGLYTITETVATGYQLTDITCLGDTDSNVIEGVNGVQIDLANGEQIDCTFTNTQLGSITVEKQTSPADSAQLFSFTGNASGSIADNGTITVNNLLPGVYTSTEGATAGWDLTDISCNDDNSTGDLPNATANFNVGPGENVICTFTNTIQRGNIVVVKQTDPDGSAVVFDFTTSYGAPFGLADGQQNNSGPLLPTSESSTYSVTEAAEPGWTQTSAVCSDGSPANAIDLAPGETVTCTFTNTIQRGQIIVDKVTDPAGSVQLFDFTLTGVGVDQAFQLADATTPYNSGDLLPTSENGTYNVAEAAVAGWVGVGVCSDGSPAGAVDLAPGEVVTCTFTNTETPTINLVKTASGPVLQADGTYTVIYTITATNAGGPGVYDLTDTFSPAAGITLNTAELTSYASAADSQNGTVIGGSIPASFVNGDTIVTGEDLSPGNEETWTITANFTVVAAELNSDATACVQGAEVAGTGFYNYVDGNIEEDTTDNDACVNLPDPIINLAKTSTAAVSVGANTWEVVYTITATNTGEGPGVYDIIDVMMPGTGITPVIDASYPAISYAGGEVQSGDLTTPPLANGGTWVTGEALAALSAESWTVTARFTVDLPALIGSPGSEDCILAGDEQGTGYFNYVEGSATDIDLSDNETCVEHLLPMVAVPTLNELALLLLTLMLLASGWYFRPVAMRRF